MDALRQLSTAELESFLVAGPTDALVEVIDEVYASELVNLLLGLRKAAVKTFFDRVTAVRKRNIAPVLALYLYKEYLTNPLPLSVTSVGGKSLPNVYALLGVPRSASDEQLKAAYALLAKAHAPESSAPETRRSGELRLEELKAAYEAVKTPKRREKIDQELPNINYLYPKREQSWFEKLKKILD